MAYGCGFFRSAGPNAGMCTVYSLKAEKCTSNCTL
jgi:hypothetical protein